MIHDLRTLPEAVAVWIASAPAAPLPVRTVLVSSERIAHAFRRELAGSGDGRRLLTGTRFVAPAAFAAELLLLDGRPLRSGAESLRPVALESLFASEKLRGRLEYLDLDILRHGSGSADAVAATLDDLSDAGLDSKTLMSLKSPRVKDLGLIWSLLPTEVVDRHTILRQAAPLAAKWRDPVFALIESAPGASLAAFIEAFDVACLKPEVPASGAAVTELQLLQSQFLRAPGDKRERSKGVDGSLHLEIHAGVDEELRAATDWVASLVRRGTPLERVAVLAPQADPWLGLLHDRLAALPWPGDAPLLVAGGLPLRERPAGMRFLALLDSLSSGLRVQELLRVLPHLKAGEGHLSPAQARTLVWNCGTLGGSPVNLKGAADWLPGLDRRVRRLEELVALDPVPDRREREVEEARRALEPTRALRPALAALVALAKQISDDRPLADLGPAVLEFWKSQVREPDDLGLGAQLREKLQPLLEFDRRGAAALGVLQRSVDRLRVPVGRFGEPRVFLGTPSQAAGIPFDAVRFVGLSESGTPGDDPLLSDDERKALSPKLATSTTKARRSLSDLCSAVQHVGREMVFSAPRQSMDDTVCEASTMFLEAAMAVGRHPADGKLDTKALWQLYIRPGREALAKARYLAPPRMPSTPPDPLDGRIGPPLELKAQSPSRLKTFLECPHHYLLEHVLHWSEPDGVPDPSSLDALTYGTLVHGILEDCGEQKLDLAKGLVLADERFDRLVESYPLAGESRKREKDRLLGDIRRALQREAQRGTTLVAAEQPFGWDKPVLIEELPVHGYIDRLDRTKTGVEVRDYKTGRAKDEPKPDPVVDLQIGVYALASEEKAAAAEYAYVSDRHNPYRRFEGAELANLLQATGRWLRTAKNLLEAGLFPRTSRQEDCKYCPFQPICGPRPWETSPVVWAGEPRVQVYFNAKASGGRDDAE